MSMFSERRLIAKFKGSDFYISRDLPNPIASIKENPVAPIGIVADIAHRTFKIGSDVLRVFQGENRQELSTLDGAFAPRTYEATVGAVSNVVGGFIDIFRGKLLAGPARILQGGLDVIDIPVSAVADVATTATGVKYSTRGKVSNALAA